MYMHAHVPTHSILHVYSEILLGISTLIYTFTGFDPFSSNHEDSLQAPRNYNTAVCANFPLLIETYINFDMHRKLELSMWMSYNNYISYLLKNKCHSI